jgi:uncharacterized tellurite resistance protein B-like protein
MLDSIKEKTSKLSKGPLVKYFSNKDYIQDSDDRKVQICFYKLLMILAYSDGTMDEEEMNVFKDYVYEQCLTEQEWREIEFYKFKKPSNDELKELMQAVLSRIEGLNDKVELINAFKEIVESDNILKKEEQEIVTLLNEMTNKKSASLFANIFNKVKYTLSHSLKAKQNQNAGTLDYEYSKNPISAVLKEKGFSVENIEVVSAKIGIVLLVIQSNMEFDEKEKIAFREYVSEVCKVENNQLDSVIDVILAIPDSYFELSYLSRIIVDSLNEIERKEFLAKLFAVARADKVYDEFEDRILRVIANSMFIDHASFIKVKNS